MQPCVLAAILPLQAACANPYASLVKASNGRGDHRNYPKKLAGWCSVVGLVYPDDDAHHDTYQGPACTNLRIATVRRGGNTLLMSSPGTSADGVAYQCNPPIKPDSDG